MPFENVYYDEETNGFLENLNVIHSLVIQDLDTGEVMSCADQPGYVPIATGVAVLEKAQMRVGHNSIKFDEQATRKVYPGFKPLGRTEDSLVKAKVVIPKDDLRKRDFLRVRKGFPAKLLGRYSLEAFGERIAMAGGKEGKGDFKGPWDVWTKEMQDYCERDTRVGVALWRMLSNTKHYHCSDEALATEYRVAEIVARQERRGVWFNERLAHDLYATLVQRKMEVERDLAKVFRPMFLQDGGTKAATGNPKKDYRRHVPEHDAWVCYTAYAPFIKVRLTEFNPGSRIHIETWLRRLHGWEPTEFGADGHATVDDEIIRSLPWPEAKLLSEYLMLEKRIGQVSTGKEAWLKHVKADGCIHGSVDTLGAGTARMTHSKPNLAQVPGLVDKKNGGKMPYGKECRTLFGARICYELVGCDADALELRCLAGYMAKYDGGAYIRTVLAGDKSLGTDMHSVNMRALGITSRDTAKTWFYAFIYGSGDENLGMIVGAPKSLARARGKSDRAKFLKNLPAMGRLVSDVKKMAEQGYLVAIDGRRIPVRSAHSALNTLLQSAGAIFMKKALVILDDKLLAMGLTNTDHTDDCDYEFVINCHDEWQIESLKGEQNVSDAIGKAAKASIIEAGEFYKFPCPLDGNYSIGQTWADTH